jgi:hypothetical protein
LNEKRIQLTGLVIAGSVFGLACFLPAVYQKNGLFMDSDLDVRGWEILIIGWMAYWLAWLANPLSLIAVIMIWSRHYGAAGVLSGLGIGLSLIPLFDLGRESAPQLRLEHPMALILGHYELRLGYFAWICSHCVVAISASLLWYLVRVGRIPICSGYGRTRNVIRPA